MQNFSLSYSLTFSLYVTSLQDMGNHVPSQLSLAKELYILAIVLERNNGRTSCCFLPDGLINNTISSLVTVDTWSLSTL